MRALALLLGLLPWMAGAQSAEAPRDPGASVPVEATERPDSVAAPSLTPPPAPPPAPRSPAASERLVGGAPVFDPNVAVHIVEKKQFKDQGKSELVLYPVVTQVNGEYTQHFGTALSYVFHLQENFGLQLTPIFNWSARNSAFDRELNNSISKEGNASASLLLKYGALLGVEVAPLYGKFAIYDGLLAHYSLVFNGGAGVASTQHELKVGNQFGPSTYGDTGYKYLFEIGGGMRIQIADRFTLRLEVRDLVYSARVDRVNGCNASDLNNLLTQRALGVPLSEVAVSSSCNVKDFSGTSAKTGYNRENDLSPASQLANDPSSDVLNNVGFYAGFGVAF